MYNNGKRYLRKSRTDKKISGVCGGLANYLDVDSTMVRLAWAICVVFGGAGILLYILAAIIIPYESDYYNQY
nr:PspC domain-containing protein [uncultured Peptostreptococcus sp.]